jgi:hypothetical protein
MQWQSDHFNLEELGKKFCCSFHPVSEIVSLRVDPPVRAEGVLWDHGRMTTGGRSPLRGTRLCRIQSQRRIISSTLAH